MNSQKAGLRTGSIIFALVCLGHIWRLIKHVDVRIGPHHVPMWVSGMALIATGALSIWLWMLSK